jgi:hypothetical protein
MPSRSSYPLIESAARSHPDSLSLGTDRSVRAHLPLYAPQRQRPAQQRGPSPHIVIIIISTIIIIFTIIISSHQQAAADMRGNPDAFGRNVKTAMKGGNVGGKRWPFLSYWFYCSMPGCALTHHQTRF